MMGAQPEAAASGLRSFPTTVTGVDGKTYPSTPLPAEDRDFLVAAAHSLHCSERLSVRRTLARIQERHDVRRSVGWAAGVLKTHRCDHCSGVSVESPEQSDPAEEGQ